MHRTLLTYCLIVGVYLSAFLMAEEPTYTAVQDQSYVPILTPSLSERQTLKLRLANGLEAYLINDPEATQAGAVLTVQAGSWDDPEEHPGLAHFLEHMLFLGTKKYPIESDYDRFIRGHNGKSNAYTTTDYTLYLFSIQSSAFEEGLDRFSSFFKEPLFNPSGVDRELNAVNQEFAKNRDQDSFRENHVLKELANAQHPFHRFSIGNSETLSKVTQDILRQWYQEHYSAHLMRLIVYGPQSLETLKSWVIQDFKEIPSTWKQPLSPQVPILGEDLQGKIVYIEPVKNISNLQMTWELPVSSIHSTSFRPEDFIISLLEDEGEGSLLSILKTEDLANNLNAAESRISKDRLLLSLDINLTLKGLENIPQVMEQTFQVIQTLQQQDFPAYLFEELKKIQMINYQYQSRGDVYNTLMNLGGLLVYEELSTFPESVLIPQQFQPHLVREFLSYLTPQRAVFTVMTPDPSVTFDHTEQWAGVPYKIATLPSEQLATLSHLPLHSSFYLPAPNPFIPQDLKLVNSFSSQKDTEKTIPHPQLLVDNEKAKIYFAADDRYQLPKTMWFFEIKTPLIESSDPTKSILGNLYISSLEEALSSYSYSAHSAGLSYHISRTTNGILISLSGYRDNAEILFDTILKHLKSYRPSKQIFHIFKYSLLGQYEDSNRESTLKQGLNTYQSILYAPSTTHQQRIEALETISYEFFLNYLDHLYDQTYVEGLLYGNISQSQALQVYQKLQNTLNSQAFPREQQLIERVVELPAESGPHMIELPVPVNSHAAILVIEAPSFSLKMRAAQQILEQAMSSAFYATLRTKQQTGYLIFSNAEEIDRHLFTLFAVQSATHDPRDLLARFELFIEGFLQDMEKNELTAEEFERIRDSLLNSLEHYPQNLTDTGYLLKTLAFKYDGDFDWMTKRIQGLKKLTYEEFLEISKQLLGKQNKRRLAVLVRGTADQDFHYELLSNPQEMRERSEYTSSS